MALCRTFWGNKITFSQTRRSRLISFFSLTCSSVEPELQLPAYTTATAMPDPSCIRDLHHSPRQCWIFNPMIKARDRARILVDSSQAHYCWATTGTSHLLFSLIIKSNDFILPPVWLLSKKITGPLCVCDRAWGLCVCLAQRHKKCVLLTQHHTS